MYGTVAQQISNSNTATLTHITPLLNALKCYGEISYEAVISLLLIFKGLV